MEYNDRYTVGKIEVGGGFVIFGGGFVKRGVRPNPPNPLWLRACVPSLETHGNSVRLGRFESAVTEARPIVRYQHYYRNTD